MNVNGLPTSSDGWPILEVDSGEWKAACRRAKEERELNFLASLTAVHYLDDGHLLLAAHAYRIAGGMPLQRDRLLLLTKLEDKVGVEVDSVADVWRTAEWHEREVWDMFGVRFVGHPNLKRILMEEAYESHPLRKDFVDHKPNLGVSAETLRHDAASKR